MKIKNLNIQGVLVITPTIFEDDRGFFFEPYNKRALSEIGIKDEFVQDNHSQSTFGVVRGIHYQKKHPQGKLIRVIQGEVLDFVVDIRKGSPTFGKWVSVLISADNKKQIWIPGGLAHGFSVQSETAEFCYKVTDYYHPEDEKGIRWNDPELNVDWKINEPMLSERDQYLPLLKDAYPDLPVFKPDSIQAIPTI